MWKIILFSLIAGVYCAKKSTTSQKESLIVMEESEVEDNLESRAGLEDELCTPQSLCIPISSCPLLNDLLDKSCLASDNYFRRLSALTCGWSDGGPHVCCPPGGISPLRPSRDPSPLDRPPGVQGDDSAVSNPQQSQPATESCGKPMVQSRNYQGIGSHPWVVRIGFKPTKDSGPLEYPCTGSIISRRVVLTAAHCALLKTEGYKLSSVAVGEWNTDTDPDCGDMFCATPVQVIPMSYVVTHPGYDKKIYRHDIAMIVLRDDIKYTVTSLPVCLSGTPPPGGIRGHLSGWGRLPGQRVTITSRQHLTVPLLPLGDCARFYSASAPLSTSQLCAGGEAGKDACAGFGGSPLVIMIDGRYTQIGIVSFGSPDCGKPGVPSVYTSIHSYANWIRDNSPPS